MSMQRWNPESRTFRYDASSRNAWNKTIIAAIGKVIGGAMTEAEFLAQAPPSPDTRDPLPAKKLAGALAKHAARQARKAEERAANDRRNEEMGAMATTLRDERLWSLGLAPIFGYGWEMIDAGDAKYSLAELEAWAAVAGVAFAGRRFGQLTRFIAAIPERGLFVQISHNLGSEDRANPEGALADLADWAKRRRVEAAQ